MTFDSVEFLLFFAIVFAAYHATRSWRWQNLLLIAAGYVFYGWWDVRFLGLLILSTLADYTAGRVMGSAGDERARKTAFVLVLTFNLGLLGVFKYFNFFAGSFAAATHAAFGWEPGWTTLNVALPVGISFYTFQSIGYSIDVYRRQIPPTTDYLAYSAFVAFFPQLVAGPIERAGHLLRQMAGPRDTSPDDLQLGFAEFVWGLGKKIVIADYLAPHVNAVFADLPGHSPGSVALATVVFAFQIYGDFSAYSDMARGLARMMGFHLVKNFDTPYFATSLQDFWHRWHMSLSGWFRDYLYFPLGGSRKGELRTHANTMAVFLVSGLWHGAAWTYVLWGGLHGAGLCIGRATTRRFPRPALPAAPRLAALLGGAATFAFVCAGWYLFRAADLASAIEGVRAALFRAHDAAPLRHDFDQCLHRIGTLAALDWFTREHGLPVSVCRLRPAAQVAILAALLLAMGLYASKQGVQFIYFQF